MDDLRPLDLIFGLSPVSRVREKEGFLSGSEEDSVSPSKTTKVSNILKAGEEDSI
jgi:hypothetical protein